MKRSQLALAIAGLLASSVSHALVDSTVTTAGAAGYGPSLWAQELDANQTTALKLLGCTTATNCGTTVAGTNSTATPLDATFTLGVAMSTAQALYLRIDLSGDAKFGADPSCVVPVGAQCNKSVGGSGNNYVTFTLSTGTSSVSFADKITLGMTGASITPANTSSDITMTYSLHNSPQSSENGSSANTARLYSKAFPYVKFVPSIVSGFTATGALASPGELTSEVTANFLQFKGPSANQLNGELGKFYFGAATGDIYTTDGTSAVLLASALDKIVGTGTTFEIDGGAGAAGSFAFLQDVNGTVGSGLYSTTSNARIVLATTSCATTFPTSGMTNATSVTADKATFSLVPAAGTPVMTGLYYVCLNANGVTSIPTRDYTGYINPLGKAAPKTNPGKSSGSIGKIKQDGSVLDTPFMTIFPGYQSKVFLTNTGSADVNYETVIVTDDGATQNPPTTSKAKGTVPAAKNGVGGLLQINVTDLVASITNPAFPGRQRIAVRFILTGSNKTLNGVYQTVKMNADGTTSSGIQSIPLIRQGGG